MNDRKTFGLQLRECFPKTITGVNLAYGPNTEITKTNVAWSFREFVNLSLDGAGPGLAEKLVDTATQTVERAITANVPSETEALLATGSSSSQENTNKANNKYLTIFIFFLLLF